MTDRTVEHPNRYQLTLVDGTTDIYDLTPVPGTITAAGTNLNKATLLTDETAAALGLDPNADPTINDAFSATADTLDMLSSAGVKYAVCDTAGATAEKVVNFDGFKLVTGVLLGVVFTYKDTSTNPTLNVNNTGAAAIYNFQTGTNVTSGNIIAGMTALLIYNGAQWVLLNPSSAQVFEKIMTVELTSNKTAVSLNLSSVDTNDYIGFQLRFHGGVYGSLTVNNVTSGYEEGRIVGGTSSVTGSYMTSSKSFFHMGASSSAPDIYSQFCIVDLMVDSNYGVTALMRQRTSTTTAHTYLESGALPGATNLNSIQLSGTIKSGAIISLYGIRK